MSRRWNEDALEHICHCNLGKPVTKVRSAGILVSFPFFSIFYFFLPCFFRLEEPVTGFRRLVDLVDSLEISNLKFVCIAAGHHAPSLTLCLLLLLCYNYHRPPAIFFFSLHLHRP